MTKSQTLTLTGFVLLGAVVVWQFVRISEMEKARTAERNQAVAAEESAVPRASAGGSAMPQPGPGPMAGPPDEPPGRKPKDPERVAKMRADRERDRKLRHDAKILDLTTKLNLTAEQKTAIRAALDKGAADRDALREAAFSRPRPQTGDTEETRRADMAKFAALNAAQEEAIAAGLSAEQLAAYSEYKTEQKQTTVENRANQQLGDLLRTFSLTEDQKDAAFQFFARQEQENGFDPDRVAAMGGDFVSLFDQRQKNELEALKRILTPEQYELYKTQQEQRTATFRNMVPGAGPGRP
ncbi:MAG: hypothetical protein V4726_24975 [Verrucomicrobiota bacterium]